MTAPNTPAPAPAAPAAPTAPAPTKFQQALETFKKPPPAPAPAAPAAPAALAGPDPDLADAQKQAAYLAQQRAITAAKKQADEAASKLKSLEVFEGKDSAAILKALRARGHTVESLVKAMGTDEEPEQPPETDEQREIRELREWREKKEREEAEREAQSVFQQNVATIGEMLKAQADKYPALSSFARAPQVLAQRWTAYVKENGEPEEAAEQAAVIGKIAADFDAQVSADVDNILSGDVALKAFLTRHKDRALSILGAKQSAGPASEKGAGGGKGAPVVPSTGGERKTSQLSHEEKRAAALGVLKQRHS